MSFRYGLMEAFTMHHTDTTYGVPCKDRLALIQKARDLGFDGVEFGLDMDFLEDPFLREHSYQQELRELAEEWGVENRSLCLHLLNYQEHSPASEEPAHRETAITLLEDAMQACHQSGISVLLLPFFGPAALRTQERIDHLIREMRELAPTAESLGLCLALETSLEAPAMRQIVDAIGSSAVQVYFDTGNGTIYDYDLVREVEILADNIAQVHIKNHPAAPKLLEGKVSFPPVIEALQGVDFQGYLVLELPAADEGIVQANLQALKGMVAASR